MNNGNNCILNKFNEPLLSQLILFKNFTILENTSEYKIEEDGSKNYTENDFIFFEEYKEECREITISYWIIFVIIGTLIGMIILIYIIVRHAMKYRNQYDQVINEIDSSKEMTEIQTEN